MVMEIIIWEIHYGKIGDAIGHTLKKVDEATDIMFIVFITFIST